MTNIKVTVSYEKPTTSKFDALMAEYEAAKKYADETVAYYKPLADAAENAKFDAIMEQLETIKEYARRISEINNGKSVLIQAHISSSLPNVDRMGEEFTVQYRPKQTTYEFEITSAYRQFTKEHVKYHSETTHNFIGMWDEWGVYNKLEKHALCLLREAIMKQQERAYYEINRLRNITKEEIV